MRHRFLFFALLIFLPCFFAAGCAHLNDFQTQGSLGLKGLSAPVAVKRDDLGIPHIYAQNKEDLFFAQGFVCAQDRLFQMALMKMMAQGRISELAGQRTRNLDARMRTMGLFSMAKTQAALLNPQIRLFFQRYVDGVNAYISQCPDTHPLEFKLARLTPEPWEVADVLSVLYLMSLNTSANVRGEVVAQMLVEKLGMEKASELFPITINPDAPSANQAAKPANNGRAFARLGADVLDDPVLARFLDQGPLLLGSNNWAVSGAKSENGRPVVANDPHLDAHRLPGPWHPVGLCAPGFSALGVSIPGIPGIIIGRNEDVAFGVTNAYGDIQDLYVETVDPRNPDHYLEGETSIPFGRRTETIKIKDKKAPGDMREEILEIRFTHRGPVVSSVLPGLETDKVLTMRWSVAETMGPALGLDRFLDAKTARDIRDAIKDISSVCLNFVFADTKGDMGWHTSGRVPVRTRGDGGAPVAVTGEDNWAGWIPFDQMPHAFNPEKGWVGTCNHYTVPEGFPYPYTTYASPTFRYRRLKELMNTDRPLSASDHWAFQRDTANLLARRAAPVFADILARNPDFKWMGEMLGQWDFADDPNQAAPLLFQSLFRHLAMETFEDELGEKLARTMLGVYYFWHERFLSFILAGQSPWFDDVATGDTKETLADLVLRAARKARTELTEKFGKNPEKWKWGKAHTLTFVNPIRERGFGSGLLGGQTHACGGSGETLMRGIYPFNKPYGISVSASFRMVADLSDKDRLLAVLPGGATGRSFHPHFTDQVRAFVRGEKIWWPFSRAAVDKRLASTLVLKP